MDETVDVLLLGRTQASAVPARDLAAARRLTPWLCLLRTPESSLSPEIGDWGLSTLNCPDGKGDADRMLEEVRTALDHARLELFPHMDATPPREFPELWLANRVLNMDAETADHADLVDEMTSSLMRLPGAAAAGILLRNPSSEWTIHLCRRHTPASASFEEVHTRLVERSRQCVGREFEEGGASVCRKTLTSNGAVFPGERLWLPVPVATSGEVFGTVLVEFIGDIPDLLVNSSRLRLVVLALANVLKGREKRRFWLIRDPLTGCYNRRHLDQELDRLIEKTETKGVPFSMMLLDVDYFKPLNDIYGHRTGDECLERLVVKLLEVLRPGDSLVRWGGDEFLALFPDTASDEAAALARRIHSELREDRPIMGMHHKGITLSSGLLTHCGKGGGIRKDELIDKIDRALYESKRKGRDQFTVWKEAPDENFADLPLYHGRGTSREGEGIDHDCRLTLDALLAVLDAREFETALHCRRVARLVAYPLRRLGITGREYRDIVHGAMLHDIGKIAIPDRILHKEGPLTDHEKQVMRNHPRIGHRFIQSISAYNKAGEIILYHHENFDGRGYPRGLHGEEIPLGVRIFSPVDVYDTMRSNRVYKDAMSHEEAVEEIRANAGTQFDPRMVKLFLELIPELELLGFWQT